MLLRILIFFLLLLVPFLGESRDTQSLEVMIDKNLRFVIAYKWLRELSFEIEANEIIPLRLLGCGAFGCVYRVCYKGNCDIAMKVGSISDTEAQNYEKASSLGLVPFLHRSIYYSTLPPQIYDTESRNSSESIEGAVRGKGGKAVAFDIPNTNQVKGWIILTDLYPMTVADYIDEKYDKEPLDICIARLKELAHKSRFYHGDLHLNNIMVGSDLIDFNRSNDFQKVFEDNIRNDADYVPLAFIDLGFSNFNKSDDRWILGEWRSLSFRLREASQQDTQSRPLV